MTIDTLIYDDNCPTCCFIKCGLQRLTYGKLEFISVTRGWPRAARHGIDKEDLRATLHYITAAGDVKINAEACLCALSNIRMLGFIKHLYFWPFNYLFDLIYFILKKSRKVIK